MDVQLPGDEDWIRITADIVWDQNQKRNNVSNNQVRRRLAESSLRQNGTMSTRMGLTRGRYGGFGDRAVVSLFSQSPNGPDTESQTQE